MLPEKVHWNRTQFPGIQANRRSRWVNLSFYVLLVKACSIVFAPLCIPYHLIHNIFLPGFLGLWYDVYFPFVESYHNYTWRVVAKAFSCFPKSLVVFIDISNFWLEIRFRCFFFFLLWENSRFQENGTLQFDRTRIPQISAGTGNRQIQQLGCDFSSHVSQLLPPHVHLWLRYNL